MYDQSSVYPCMPCMPFWNILYIQYLVCMDACVSTASQPLHPNLPISTIFPTPHISTSLLIPTNMADLSSVYQSIFDADIAEASGVRAVLSHEPKSDSEGYVLVNEVLDAPRGHDVLAKVVIPEQKRATYALAEKLFDNYILSASRPDDLDAPEHLTEVNALLDAVLDSAPMRLARAFINRSYNVKLSDPQWRNLVQVAWFRPFRSGSSRSRNGFEHVLLGEMSRSGKLGGLHWWYFYDYHEEDISYDGANYGSGDASSGLAAPEVVTMSFSWEVEFDNRTQDLNKPKGGFFVGPSVEGMMALGMVRLYDGQGDAADVVMEGMELGLRMYREGGEKYPSIENPKAINTFFPALKRVLGSDVILRPPTPPTRPPQPTTEPTTLPTAQIGTVDGTAVRISALVVNPMGRDEGMEGFTLLNIGTTSAELRGWHVRAPNGTKFYLGDFSLKVGQTRSITIPARVNVRFRNRAGDVALVRSDGNVEHKVSYDRTSAKKQGGVLVWDGQDKMILV